MSKYLIFIDNKDEIDKIPENVLKDAIIISFLPAVCNELTLRGITHENTKLLFGIDGHKEVLKISKLIVERLRPLLKKIKTNKVQQAFEKTWILYFRFNLNYWLSMLFIINKAVKKHNPDKIFILRSKSKSYKSLSRIVESYSASNGVEIKYFDNFKLNYFPHKKDKLLTPVLKKIFFEFQLRLFSIFFKKRNALLALSDSHNMPGLLGKLSRHYADFLPIYISVQSKTLIIRILEMIKGKTFSFVFLPSYISKNLKSAFQARYDNCAKEIRILFEKDNSEAIFYNVNLSNEIMNCIEGELKKRMVLLYGELVSLNRAISFINPKGVFAQHNLGIGYVLGEVCSLENIPGLLITHGTHTPQNDYLSDYEWSVHAHTLFNGMYPFVAAQSPWAKKFLNQQKDVISTSIETGSLTFAKKSDNLDPIYELRLKLFGKSHLRKKIVLHAGSPREWESLRPLVFETIDEYIHNINITIQAIEAIPELYLCIRFRPKINLTLKDFKRSLVVSDCYDIYTEGLFEEFLLASDLLISYSSTTIEEALQSNIPVLQFDPDDKYEHIQGKKLPTDGINSFSTVYSVYAENDLMPALNWWQENHSKAVNSKLNWSEHVFKDIDYMDLLEVMDIKC